MRKIIFITIALWIPLAQALTEPSSSAVVEPLRAKNPYATCGSQTSQGTPWTYCIYRYPNSTNKVAYYFHGILGSEHSWETEGGEKVMLRRLQETGKAPPTIVAISFGREWFLAEKNSSPQSGLFETYINHVLPYIQNHLLGFTSEENLLLGVSMGGLNASQLYFKQPGFFTRAAIICGAMSTVSPFASKEEVKDYIKRTGASSWLVTVALAMAKRYFPTPSDWDAHSPVHLAKNFLTLESPPLFMSNGLKDKYGFHEGNLAFIDIATQIGFPIESHFNPDGGHCGDDPALTADFLIL